MPMVQQQVSSWSHQGRGLCPTYWPSLLELMSPLGCDLHQQGLCFRSWWDLFPPRVHFRKQTESGIEPRWKLRKSYYGLLTATLNVHPWVHFYILSSCHHAGDPGGAPGFGQTLPRLLLGSESAGAIYYFLFFLCLLLISRRNDEDWHGTLLQIPLHEDEGWMNGCLVPWRFACQGLSRTCIRLKNHHQMDKKERASQMVSGSVLSGFLSQLLVTSWFLVFRTLISKLGMKWAPAPTPAWGEVVSCRATGWAHVSWAPSHYHLHGDSLFTGPGAPVPVLPSADAPTAAVPR